MLMDLLGSLFFKSVFYLKIVEKMKIENFLVCIQTLIYPKYRKIILIYLFNIKKF